MSIAFTIKTVLFASLALGMSTVHAAELHVFAAASLTDALKEIAQPYEKAGGDKVRFNFGASSVLARQIQEGAPADVFFSADEEKMDALAAKGLIKKGSRRTILSNSMVVILAENSNAAIAGPQDLLRLRRIALAEPSTVPAGIYARKYLQSAGVWEQIKGKVVPTENVRGALAAVEAGNVDAAIVFKTDAAMSKKIKTAFEVKASEAPKISYPAAVIADSKQAERAEAFVRHLTSEASRNVFERHGFVVIKE